VFAQLDSHTTTEQHALPVKPELSGMLLPKLASHAPKLTFLMLLLKDVSAHPQLHTFLEEDALPVVLVNSITLTPNNARAAQLQHPSSRMVNVWLAQQELIMILTPSNA
jgi:hypothetical protein